MSSVLDLLTKSNGNKSLRKKKKKEAQKGGI